jgi:hypothetical protein
LAQHRHKISYLAQTPWRSWSKSGAQQGRAARSAQRHAAAADGATGDDGELAPTAETTSMSDEQAAASTRATLARHLRLTPLPGPAPVLLALPRASARQRHSAGQASQWLSAFRMA